MAAPASTVEIMRRSTRVRAAIGLRVRSLDPSQPFDILTRTVIVNAHGCGFQSTLELPIGVRAELEINGRTACGTILNSALIDADRNVYLTGLSLDQPSNFWEIPVPPADWLRFSNNNDAANGVSIHPFAKKKSARVTIDGAVHPFARPASAEPSKVAQGTVPAGSPQSELLAPSASQLQQWRADATAALTTIRDDLQRKLANDAESWRAETQRAIQEISDLLRRADEQARSAAQQVTRIESAATAAQADIAAGLAGLQRAAAAQPTEEELARLRTEIQGLTQSAPALVERLVRERAGQAMDAVALQAQEKLSAVLAPALDDLRRRIEEMAGATAADTRTRLLSEFDTRQKQFLDAAAARLADIEEREKSFRQSSTELAEEVARRATEAMNALREKMEKSSASAIPSAVGAVQETVGAALQRLNSSLAAKQTELLSSIAAESVKTAEESRSLLRQEAERSAAELSAKLSRQAEEAMAGLRLHVEQASAASLAKLSAGFESAQQKLDTRVQEQSWEYEAQVEAAAARLQEKLAVALQQLEADIERRHEQLAAETVQSGQKLTEENLASIRAENERKAKEIRESIEQELTLRNEDLAARQRELDASAVALRAQHEAFSKDLNQLQETRGYIESVLAALPETVRSHTERQASEVWDRLRAQSEQVAGETLRAETERGTLRLRDEIQAAARQLREEMALHAQQTATELQSQISDTLSARQRELADELDARLREAAARETSEFAARAQVQAEAHRRQAEAVHDAARQRLEEVAKRSDQLLGETEAALLKSASEVVNDEVARARREVREQAASESESLLASLRERSAEAVAADIASAKHAASEATDAVARLQALQEGAEAGSMALKAQLEQAQLWLQSQSAEFQKTVHDAFLSAGGEIRGRVHSAVDTADELIRQKSKDAISQLDRQTEEAQARICAMRADAADSAEKELKARLLETLDVFRNDASRLAESALSRWQSAMDETLRAIPSLLKTKLEEAGKSPEGTAGAAATD